MSKSTVLAFGLSIITGFEAISRVRERERYIDREKKLADKQVNSLC